MADQKNFEGTVVKGVIVHIDQAKQMAVIDIGLKSEGRVSLKDVMGRATTDLPQVGDSVDVYVERMEDRHGDAVLSVTKARVAKAWQVLEEAFAGNQTVTGTIFGRVKGGYVVDMDGPVAFLPGSQIDLRSRPDVGPLMNTEQRFKILKIDSARSNIVVSRRVLLEEEREEVQASLVGHLEEGQIVDGVVKNITDYGAFVDLGGMDGLLHVTDIAWKRLHHPGDVLTVGQKLRVKILKFNKETRRISLGIKQLECDPWENIEGRYPVGKIVKGKVTNLTDYGAFVELEPAIEGLIYLSELSWTKKNIHPSRLVSIGDSVDVKVLDVDETKRRLSLGLKQCAENPWERIKEIHPVGSTFEGEIRNITEFGIFVSVTDDLDGMVHLSDLSWDESGEDAVKAYHKGQRITLKVMNIDPDNERISLSIKHLTPDSFAGLLGDIKKNEIVKCIVEGIADAGITVSIDGCQLKGFIKAMDLSRNRSEQRVDMFKVGDSIEAKVYQIDRVRKQVLLSIKGAEFDEEKKVLSEMRKGTRVKDMSFGAALEDALSEKN